MAFKTADGKPKSSKFRAHRADREHGKPPTMHDPGERAQADKMEEKPEGDPESPGEERAEEQINSGIHDEVKQVMAEHGPAHTINTIHDHEAQTSHVHSIHADGHEHHADHSGEGHVKLAHEHGAIAAGSQEPEAEQPQEQNPMGDDDYQSEPL